MSRVAAFLGFTNTLRAKALREASDYVELETCHALLVVPRSRVRSRGQETRIMFRPESAEVTLRREKPSQLEGVLTGLLFQGRSLRARVITEQGEVEASVPRPERQLELRGRLGGKVYVDLTAEELMIF